jgi:hypothetical protein
MDWANSDAAAVDHSHWLTAPAGQDGFIRVEGNRLVAPNGKRFRIWGVNICAGDCFPSHEDADRLAADLARLGFNCVRFHHMDATWGRNIFDPSRDDTRQLDSESMDRLDYLVAALKKRGIYSNLNLNVSRHFKAGDGVRDHELLGYAKSATYFNPRLIELQQEFARQLLTHRNAYTGNEYRHEPAVAFVEMVNENSVLEGWVGWRLVGKDDPKATTWSPIPISYAEELNEQYNAWLATNVSADEMKAIRDDAGIGANDRVPRLMPNQFEKASKLRFHTEARFYMELETRFFEGMKRLLADELGAKAVLVGSSDHNDGVSGYPHVRSNMVFDLIDGHGYWEHPRIGPITWIKNTPMVNDPLDSTVVQFARTPVGGRPYTISETNHPFPHEYACEGFPILTAYALLQDWDGIYWFTWGRGRLLDAAQGIQRNGWFDISNDPVKLANLAACAAMWHRQDVAAAEQTIARSYTTDEIIESLRMKRDQNRPFFTPGFARSTALETGTRWTLDGSPASEFPPAAAPGRIEARTGQLGWHHADRQKGLVLIDSPGTQGLIGFVKAGDLRTRNLAADVENDFCAIVLTSLDGKPIAESGRMLLAATSKYALTDSRWKEDRQTYEEWGRGPMLIEPVSGLIMLEGLQGAKGVEARSLSAVGKPLGSTVKGKQTAAGWQIAIGKPATTQWLIDVER